MIAGIGVEVGSAGFDHNFPHQARFGELVKGVVYRRQRNADAGGARFLVQILRRYMAVFRLEQQFCESDTLARRPQTSLFQLGDNPAIGSVMT